MSYEIANEEQPEIHHTDTAGIETVLKTASIAEFFIIEEAYGYSMQILTRPSNGVGPEARFIIDMVRGRGIRVWRNAETAIRYIKSICPDHLQPKGVTLIFRSPGHKAEGERTAPEKL